MTSALASRCRRPTRSPFTYVPFTLTSISTYPSGDVWISAWRRETSLPADHHVGPGVAAEDEWIGPDGIFPPVGQADQPPAGGRGGRFGRDCGVGHQVGECAAVEELGVPARRVIDGEDLMPADLDLVAVEHRRRVGAQPHAIDQQLRLGRRGADGGGALGRALQHRVLGLHALALEHEWRSPGADPMIVSPAATGYANAADFEVHHRSIPEVETRVADKRIARPVTAQANDSLTQFSAASWPRS